jgi:hypothetical protein
MADMGASSSSPSPLKSTDRHTGSSTSHSAAQSRCRQPAGPQSLRRVVNNAAAVASPSGNSSSSEGSVRTQRINAECIKALVSGTLTADTLRQSLGGVDRVWSARKSPASVSAAVRSSVLSPRKVYSPVRSGNRLASSTLPVPASPPVARKSTVWKMDSPLLTNATGSSRTARSSSHSPAVDQTGVSLGSVSLRQDIPVVPPLAFSPRSTAVTPSGNGNGGDSLPSDIADAETSRRSESASRSNGVEGSEGGAGCDGVARSSGNNGNQLCGAQSPPDGSPRSGWASSLLNSSVASRSLVGTGAGVDFLPLTEEGLCLTDDAAYQEVETEVARALEELKRQQVRRCTSSFTLCFVPCSM